MSLFKEIMVHVGPLLKWERKRETAKKENKELSSCLKKRERKIENGIYNLKWRETLSFSLILLYAVVFICTFCIFFFLSSFS